MSGHPQDAENRQWAISMWAMLKDGGNWALPRSGLLYRKESAAAELVLVARMPWDDQLPVDEFEWVTKQQNDHDGVKLMMSTIGVEVTDETKEDE